MRHRALASPAVFVVAFALTAGGVTPALGQDEGATRKSWTPARLADGQPDINGTWNNVGAAHIPLELPDELAGRELSQAERQALIEERDARRKSATWAGFENSRGVGAYENYWFDWYWTQPVAGDAPALLVEPADGRMPPMTPKARENVAYHREHLHDSYATMESGDRCVSRGTYGIMMPTAYNNGKMFFQAPGYVVILSEMIHNARIIPIDGGPHVDPKIKQWNGDPRGHWEGNTLVVESTSFRAVANQRGPGSRAPQTEQRRVIERFTIVDPETLRYELRVNDPETYAAPWTVTFNYQRDDDYQQFEYACHEGNYAVANSLSGARVQESPRH